ncbi:hypothetical protein ACLB2K_013859 [Fragaria x ananassa]
MDRSVKKAKVEDDRKDWISKLPCDVLSYMLSFLTMKDAVGTCMISHQWRHLWKHLILTRANLEFDIPNIFGGKYSQLVEELEEENRLQDAFRQFELEFFVRFVNEFLLLYRGKEVDSFKVAFFLDAESTAVLDKWVYFAISKGAKVLELKLIGRRWMDTENVYVFPHWLLSELKASTLKHLSLNRCVLQPPPDFDRLGSCLILGPSLHLKDLKVIMCFRLERFEIDAVNLSCLEYCGNHVQISCIRMPRLVRCFYSGRCIGAVSNPLPYALTQLASCPGLETLHLQIKNRRQDIPKTIPAFRNLKQVNLDILGDEVDLWSMLNLLKAAPLLEEFNLMIRMADYQEAPGNLPGYSHDNLRIFKIQGFQGKWIEIEFAICILRIATKLEVLEIDPLGKYYYGAGTWTEIACLYQEGNENEVSDEDEEELDIEDGDLDGLGLNLFLWKRRGSLAVRERLKGVTTGAQLIIL